MIRNDYSSVSDSFAWTEVGIVSAGISCDNHYGLGQFDLAVRFADVDGTHPPLTAFTLGKFNFLCKLSDFVYRNLE